MPRKILITYQMLHACLLNWTDYEIVKFSYYPDHSMDPSNMLGMIGSDFLNF